MAACARRSNSIWVDMASIVASSPEKEMEPGMIE
jgi:hypothetical protein